MGCHTGGRQKNAETVLTGRYGKLPSLFRGPVCRIDMHFKRNLQLLQEIGCFLNDGQITVAAHDDTDFLHEMDSSFCCT